MDERTVQEKIQELERQISALPIGYISKKTIHGKTRYYHQWMENGKQHGKYLREGENTILLQVMAYPPRECIHGDQKGPDWSVNKACGCCMLFSGRLLVASQIVVANLWDYPLPRT